MSTVKWKSFYIVRILSGKEKCIVQYVYDNCHIDKPCSDICINIIDFPPVVVMMKTGKGVFICQMRREIKK